MSVRTAENISAQLETLAMITDEELMNLSVPKLREQLSLLGVNTIDRAGEDVKVSSARKKELLAALKALVDKQRMLNVATVPNEFEPEFNGLNPREIYNRLVEMLSLNAGQCAREIKVLAHEVSVAISVAYPDTADQLRFNVRCNARTKVFRQVLELVLTEVQEGLRLVYDSWRQELLLLSQNDTIVKTKTYEDKKEAKASTNEAGEAIVIDLQPMLDWATRVLEQARDQKLRKTAWKDVAIALGLVTGRRMFGEILYELGTFEATGDYEVTAYELSKGKAKDDEVQHIEHLTVLCHSSLVVAGKQWLIDFGKVQPATRPATAFTKVNDREKANDKYSSDMSKYWREFAKSFGIPEQSPNGQKITVHCLRKLYVMKAVEAVAGFRSRGKEAARLLGHKSWVTANDSYSNDFVLATTN